jgi:G3E family GTPase
MLHFRSPDIGMFGRRQRHARGHRIPVSIVTAIGAPRDRETVVVSDDCADEVVLRGGTCRCCTVRGELQTEVRRLLAAREKGRHFSRVVIESRNDLSPILRTFATEQALGAEFYVEEAPPLVGTRFELTEAAPLSWDAFSRFITTFQALRGADLLHAKGLLNVEGCRGPVAVQFLGHLAQAPVELQAWPDEDQRSHLEFITRNVGEDEVRRLFDAIRAPSTSS